MRLNRPALLTLSLMLAAGAGCAAPPAEPIPAAGQPFPTAELPTAESAAADAPQGAASAANECAGTYAPAIPTAESTSLEVELFYSERWMRIQQQTALTNNYTDTWQEVIFNVPINGVPDAFFLDEVRVSQAGQPGSINPQVEGFAPGTVMLRVPLPPGWGAPGAELSFEMRYRVVIPPVSATDWPPVGNTGWGAAVIQAGEFYPVRVPYTEGEGWQTWEHHPVGDLGVYPAADASLNVITQAGVSVALGGFTGAEVLEDGRVRWASQVEGARGLAFLASDRYDLIEAEWQGLPVRSYHLPEHAEAAQAAVEAAVRSLELFCELYGPYPYTDLTIAENTYFGAMEYSGLISLTDYAYITYQGQPNSILHALTAHEVAHQWWYGAVGSDQVREPWLDESVAFYGEYLYFERYHPEFKEWWWEKRVDQFQTYGPVDVTGRDYAQSAAFITSMYGQAAYYMRDLRALLGDDAFFGFYRQLYADHQGGVLSGAQYFEALEAYTDQDLAPLRQAYFR